MGLLTDLLDKIFGKKEEIKPPDVYKPISEIRKDLGLPAIGSGTVITNPLGQPVSWTPEVNPVFHNLSLVPPAPDVICKIEDRPIYKSNDVVYWSSDLQIDADGCPRAYHPQNIGLDWLASAGSPGDWYGLVCDDKGEPVVQGLNDPAPGYYVTETAYGDPTKHHTDPRRYVDSQYVPYIAIPPVLEKYGVKLGDLCVVEYKDKRCAAVVADIGPRSKIGEGSMALAMALGINASPKNGGVESGVKFYILCGTDKPWPRTPEDIKTAEQLFEVKNVKI